MTLFALLDGLCPCSLKEHLAADNLLGLQLTHKDETIAQLLHDEAQLKDKMQQAEQFHAEAVEALHEEHKQLVNDKVREAVAQRDREHALEIEDMYEERQLVIDDVKRTEEEIMRLKHDAEQHEAGLKHDHICALRRKDEMVAEAWGLVRSQTADRNRSVYRQHSRSSSCLNKLSFPGCCVRLGSPQHLPPSCPPPTLSTPPIQLGLCSFLCCCMLTCCRMSSIYMVSDVQQ